MAAVVRVKRKIGADPANSLLLSCKRIRSDGSLSETTEEDEDQVTSLFKFAGTVDTKETQVGSHVREAIKREKLKKEYKRHVVNLPEKSRQNKKVAAHKERFKVVSSHRAIDLSALGDVNAKAEKQHTADVQEQEADSGCSTARSGSAADKSNTASKLDDEVASMFCLYDVEQESEILAEQKTQPSPTTEAITCNGVPMVREKVTNPPPPLKDYVYDIYYMNSAGFDFRAFEHICAIEAFREDNELRHDSDREDSQMYGEDEDSNDEGNYRNDYPDHDPDGDDDDDDEEEGFCYGDGEWGGNGYHEDSGLSAMIGNRLKICDSDEYSDDDDDFEYYPQPTDGASLWKTRSSYDQYRKHIMRELRQDYEEDSDDMSPADCL